MLGPFTLAEEEVVFEDSGEVGPTLASFLLPVPPRDPPCWGFLEDYAFVVRGLLDLYEASQESAWLEWALRLQDAQDRLFWDSQGGGYFCSEAELGGSLPLRVKDGQCGHRLLGS